MRDVSITRRTSLQFQIEVNVYTLKFYVDIWSCDRVHYFAEMRFSLPLFVFWIAQFPCKTAFTSRSAFEIDTSIQPW